MNCNVLANDECLEALIWDVCVLSVSEVVLTRACAAGCLTTPAQFRMERSTTEILVKLSCDIYLHLHLLLDFVQVITFKYEIFPPLSNKFSNCKYKVTALRSFSEECSFNLIQCKDLCLIDETDRERAVSAPLEFIRRWSDSLGVLMCSCMRYLS